MTAAPLPHPSNSDLASTRTEATAIAALKELVARLHREQNRIQNLLSSLGFALRSFNNLNQFLEIVPLMAARVTDADGGALVLLRPDGQPRLEQLHCQEGHACTDIRRALETAHELTATDDTQLEWRRSDNFEMLAQAQYRSGSIPEAVATLR